MTHLLDLPNELLLMVAAAVDMDGRRRFSKVCKTIFYLVRDQPNKSRYIIGWNGGEASHIELHHISDSECVLRVVTDAFGGKSDQRVIALHSENTRKVSASMWACLRSCIVPQEQVVWMRIVGDLIEECVEMLMRGIDYYSGYAVKYYAHMRTFDRSVAERLFGLRALCDFEFYIYNDGELTVHGDELTMFLLNAFLRHPVDADGSRELCVKELFVPEVWSDVQLGYSKIQESSKRILQSIIDSNAGIETDCEDSAQGNSGRELYVALHDDSAPEAYISYYNQPTDPLPEHLMLQQQVRQQQQMIAQVYTMSRQQATHQQQITLQQQWLLQQQQYAAPVICLGQLQQEDYNNALLLQQHYQHQQQPLLAQHQQQPQQQHQQPQQQQYQLLQHYQQLQHQLLPQHQQVHHQQQQQPQQQQQHHQQQQQQQQQHSDRIQPLLHYHQTQMLMQQMIVHQLELLRQQHQNVVQQCSAAGPATPQQHQMFDLREQMEKQLHMMRSHALVMQQNPISRRYL